MFRSRWLSDRDVSGLGRGQEGDDRIGYYLGGSPGQVMTRAVHELQASIRQGAGQPAGGFEGNHGVLGVGEHENRRPDRRDSVLQLIELAQQTRCSVRKVRHSGGCLRSAWPQTCQLTCSSGRSSRPCRRAIPASRARAIHGVSRHATCAHSGPAGCGKQLVLAGQAPRADAREQDHRRYPAGRQARRRQRHPAAV
jgi:hypothetical protein